MWIKLTGIGDRPADIYVNVYLIKVMERLGDMTRLVFVDGGERDVSEMPEQVIAALLSGAGGAFAGAPTA